MRITESTCRFCGVRIVLRPYAMGERWYHAPEGVPEADQHWYCQTLTAEPVESDPDPDNDQVLALVKRATEQIADPTGTAQTISLDNIATWVEEQRQ